MIKRIPYIFILLITLSCEDIYVAKLNHSDPLLVIEARFTNDVENNYVRISKTSEFYDDSPSMKVTGATVLLIDEDGTQYPVQETGAGEYRLDQVAVPGKKYQLKVSAEGEDYESDLELMPVLPEIELFHVETDTVNSYRYSSYGEPIPVQNIGNRSMVDLTVDESLSHYRFRSTTILEYNIFFEAAFGPPPPPIYGWKTYRTENKFNIFGPPRFGNVQLLEDCSVSFTKNELDPFLDDEIMEMGLGPEMVGWIVILDQFGISEKTYHLFETLNSQLEAEGKLFDPVYPQVQGNIRCVSDDEKTVVGYFEVSSYRERRYFVNGSSGRNVYNYEIEEFHTIPNEGFIQLPNPPPFWEYPGKPQSN